MLWEVLAHNDFAEWFAGLEAGAQNEIAAMLGVLATHGPTLGRPRVDVVKGSRFANMKELRVQYQGEPWRILFAFDPKRRSILLVGGNKRGDKRWYTTHIPIADARFAQHLNEMEK